MYTGTKVLLVDDETVLSNGLEKVLTRRGMIVKTAPNGQQALKLLSEQSFDVIVLDVRMPGMNGLTMLKLVRQRNLNTPVILLTGHLDPNDMDEAIRVGVAEILFKPCSISNLVTSVESACNNKVLGK